jgi:hypothetical protein
MNANSPTRIRFAATAAARLGGLALLMFIPASPSSAQLVDRIIARIEGNILTLSDLRELEKVQMLFGEKGESEAELFTRLVNQWIVTAEMDASAFPRLREDETQRAVAELKKQFPSEEAFRARLAELGLTSGDVSRVVERQVRMLRYVDYKFRSAAQPDAAEVRRYYDQELARQARAAGEALPEFDDVESRIRELLTEKKITERAARWLDETRARLRIERMGEEPSP